MSTNLIYVVCPACGKMCTKGRSLSSHLATKGGTECAQIIIQERIPETHYTIGHPDQCYYAKYLDPPAGSLVGNLNSTLDKDTEEYFSQFPDDDSTPDSGSSNSHDNVCWKRADLPPALQPLTLQDPLGNKRL